MLMAQSHDFLHAATTTTSLHQLMLPSQELAAARLAQPQTWRPNHPSRWTNSCTTALKSSNGGCPKAASPWTST